VFVLLVVCGAAALWASCGGEEPRLAPLPERAGFIGSEGCQACHEERHATWLKTAHAYSLRKPLPGIVAGSFDGKPVDTPYFTVTPHEKDGRYFFRVEGKDGRPDGDHEVTRVVGRSFEQAYLTTDPTGRWRVMPLCWSLERKEWDLTHRVLEDIAGHAGAVPEDYDSRSHVFNDGCGQCHATDYDVGHDPETNRMDSTFIEGAVSCESCHGPGSVHRQWHADERDDDEGYVWPARLVHPKKDLDAHGVLESCGRCHYAHEWVYAIDDDPRVGYDDIALGLNQDQEGFYADGRLTGLNYHGSTQSQSACFLKGDMSCISCHRMHGGKRWAMKWDGRSNKQCTQCHDAEKHGEAHTHHDETVACVDCHMPKFLKGALHFLRDHAIRAPDPALTEKFGADQSPNACNQCHADKSATWAREWRDTWWGPADPAMARDVDLIVRLRRGERGVSTEELVDAVERATSGIFFRLTALTRIIRHRRDEAQTRDLLVRLLMQDNVELLQHVCLALTVKPDASAVQLLLRLLGHESRVVRVLAGHALVRSGWRGGHGADEAMARVFQDARDRLVRQRHRVSALEQIALIADAVGTPAEADAYYGQVQRSNASRPGEWRPATLELVHRKARREAEAGRHEEALRLYALVADAGGERGVAPLVRVDIADSLAALGRTVEASAGWRAVLSARGVHGVESAIARARLEGVAGRADSARQSLLEREKALAVSPAGGELLRRVRWSLRALGGASAPGR
jgi:hypothetical protein